MIVLILTALLANNPGEEPPRSARLLVQTAPEEEVGALPLEYLSLSQLIDRDRRLDLLPSLGGWQLMVGLGAAGAAGAGLLAGLMLSSGQQLSFNQAFSLLFVGVLGVAALAVAIVGV